MNALWQQRRAARKIARIVERSIGVQVPPDDIIDLIRGEWPALAPLAHVVHGEPDTKGAGVPAEGAAQ